MMRVKYRRKDVNVMMSTEEGSDKALVARLQYPTALRIRFIKTTRVAPMDSPRFMRHLHSVARLGAGQAHEDLEKFDEREQAHEPRLDSEEELDRWHMWRVDLGKPALPRSSGSAPRWCTLPVLRES